MSRWRINGGLPDEVEVEADDLAFQGEWVQLVTDGAVVYEIYATQLASCVNLDALP